MATSAASRKVDSRLLRCTLQTNGVVTGISGVILITGTVPLTSFFGLSTPLILVVLGVVFLLAALSLFLTAVRQTIDYRAGLFYAIIDTVWVVGSVILLLGNWIPFTIGVNGLSVWLLPSLHFSPDWNFIVCRGQDKHHLTGKFIKLFRTMEGDDRDALHCSKCPDRPILNRLDTQQVQGIHIVVSKEDFKIAPDISSGSDAEQR